jgi:hypothetical protein
MSDYQAQTPISAFSQFQKKEFVCPGPAISDPSFSRLYNAVCNENLALISTIKDITDTYSTDNSKEIYQYEQYEYLVYVNTILFYSYFFLVLVLVFSLINQPYNFTTSILLVTLAVLYPFIIYPIEKYAFGYFWGYFMSLIYGDVYSHPNY